jgi:hypothetical protein
LILIVVKLMPDPVMQPGMNGKSTLTQRLNWWYLDTLKGRGFYDMVKTINLTTPRQAK